MNAYFVYHGRPDIDKYGKALLRRSPGVLLAVSDIDAIAVAKTAGVVSPIVEPAPRLHK